MIKLSWGRATKLKESCVTRLRYLYTFELMVLLSTKCCLGAMACRGITCYRLALTLLCTSAFNLPSCTLASALTHGSSGDLSEGRVRGIVGRVMLPRGAIPPLGIVALIAARVVPIMRIVLHCLQLHLLITGGPILVKVVRRSGGVRGRSFIPPRRGRLRVDDDISWRGLSISCRSMLVGRRGGTITGGRASVGGV